MGGYNQQFGVALLRRLGAPVTSNNLVLLDAWGRAEGGRSRNNPFNTTQKMPGSTDFNRNGGYPVQNYPNSTVGLEATYKTLTNGHYANIVNALRANAAPQTTAQAIASSPWGTGNGVLRLLGAPTSSSQGATPNAGTPGQVASVASNAPRTGLGAATYALSRVGRPNRPDTCLGTVAGFYGLSGSGLAQGPNDTAAGFWAQSHDRHPPDGAPPVGALVCYTGAKGSQGHIAISVGGGWIVSSDAPKSGKIGLVPVSWPVDNWHLRYAGWTPGIFPAGKKTPRGATSGPLTSIAPGKSPTGTGVSLLNAPAASSGAVNAEQAGLFPFPNPLDAASSAIGDNVVKPVLTFLLWGTVAGIGLLMMGVGLVLLALSTRTGKEAAVAAVAPEAAPELEEGAAGEGMAGEGAEGGGGGDGLTPAQRRAAAHREQAHADRMQLARDRDAANRADRLARERRARAERTRARTAREREKERDRAAKVIGQRLGVQSSFPSGMYRYDDENAAIRRPPRRTAGQSLDTPPF